jgi:aldose 1-epimerase
MEQLEIINVKTQEYITIIPDCGGLVNELVLSKSNKLYSIIDGYISADDLAEFKMHKSSKLIPFPNRIKDGKYQFAGKNYQLSINHPAENHAIHGFVYDKKFKVIKTVITKNEASINLEYIYNGDIESYPFKFLTEIIYTLTADDGFNCQTVVQNLGDTSMPFGDGWHPYFKFDKKVDELILKIPSNHKTEIDDKMIPIGNIIKFDKFSELTKIQNTEFDTGFRIENQDAIAETEILDQESNVKIIIFQETGEKKYNFLQVYIPPLRESIAIEPMTCNIDAFNNEDGLIILEPGEVFEANYGVRLE